MPNHNHRTPNWISSQERLRNVKETDKQNQESLIYSEIGVINIPSNCLSISTGYNTAYPELSDQKLSNQKRED